MAAEPTNCTRGPSTSSFSPARRTTIRRTADAEFCATQCHTPEHSDTFDRTAYLRDIVGPGHGEHLAGELGPGPTGRALRKAALERAGAVIGAGCPK